MMAAVCAASTAAQQVPLPQAGPGALPNVPACPPAQATLSPCFNDLFGSGNSSSPSAECCSQIQAMFQSQAPCLCAAMASAPFQLGSTLGQLIPALRSRSPVVRPFQPSRRRGLPPRIRRPVTPASVESLMPLHSAVAAARLRSCIAADSACWSCLSQDFALPR